MTWGKVDFNGPHVAIRNLLQQVPDKKRDKNRVHLDLRTPDLESEVTRVLGLGAVQLTEQPPRCVLGGSTVTNQQQHGG